MTPLERAARALYDRDPLNATTALPDNQIGMGSRPWDDAPKHVRDKFINHARAVLAAIREPSEDMVDAGLRSNAELGWNGPAMCWGLMIDAALAE